MMGPLDGGERRVFSQPDTSDARMTDTAQVSAAVPLDLAPEHMHPWERELLRRVLVARVGEVE